MGCVPLLEGDFKTAIKHFKKAYDMDQTNPAYRFQYARALSLDKQYDDAFRIFELMAKETPIVHIANEGLFLKYAIQGDKINAIQSVSQELKNFAKWDPQASWSLAGNYALIDEKEEALNWLENAINRGFINYPCLNQHDPSLENIREEERFRRLMERVKHEWENFEV